MKNDYLEKFMTETDSALAWLEDAVSPVKESENAMSMPESADETEPMETEPEKAEFVENAPHAAMTAAGVPPMQLPPMMPPASQPQNWMPWPQYPVTAQGVFNLALTVVPFDPARQALGFFYEQELKLECCLLIPHPIPSFFPQGIKNALRLRRSNPTVFVCQAIDVVLTYYLNYLNTENDNDLF